MKFGLGIQSMDITERINKTRKCVYIGRNFILNKKKLYLGVYGCQMNVADGERMAGELASLGYERLPETAAPDEADMILLVTCCVRETAEDKIYGKLGEYKHLKEKNPRLILGITGCMAHKEGDALVKRAPHLDFVLGTNKIAELVPLVEKLEKAREALDSVNEADAEAMSEARKAIRRQRVVDTAEKNDISEGLAIAREGSLSAWVPIMYGCNNFCTYCIVPYVRGRERSRRVGDILTEVQEAVGNGYKEITLLGQNVNSFGKDLQGEEKATFAQLLSEADKVSGLLRLRYMTSHPKDMSDEVIKAVADGEHICEHFHLPVQYGSDKILKAMNRVYTAGKYRELIRRVREAVPDSSLTTDLIVGFPGETEEDFRELLDFIKEIRYDQAYTFIYSKRSGTPAAEMENQVPEEIKHARLNELMELQNKISLEINEKLVGTLQEVMVEGPSSKNPSVWTGRTRTNKICLWTHGTELPGQLINVKVTQAQTWLLRGEIA